MYNGYPYKFRMIYNMHIWNPYNEAEEVLIETHEFCHLQNHIYW